jgi:hypothetical protein
MNNSEIKEWVYKNYYRTDGKPNSNFGREDYCNKTEITKDFFQSVMSMTTWLNGHNPKFNDRVKVILNNIQSSPKCICGKDVKLNWDRNKPNEVFNKYCSIKCSRNDDSIKEQTRLTCLEKYGVDNPSKSNKIKELISSGLRLSFSDAVTRYKINYADRFEYTDDGSYSIDGSVEVRCTLHDIKFTRNSKQLLSGETNCPECRKDGLRDQFMMTKDEFVERLSQVRNGEFTLVGGYHGMASVSRFKCKEGHEFECKADHIVGTNRGNCPYCFAGTSKQEQSFISFLKTLSENVIVNSRKHLGNGKEVDAVVDDKLMFEFNGLYWHSNRMLTNDYHLDKTKLAEDGGYRLFHVWSNEWLDDTRRDIWKSIISNAVGMPSRRIFARKCVVSEVDYPTYEHFLNTNHIQGHSNAKTRLGLFSNGELVSVMGFSKPRFDNTCDFELVRFANLKFTSVVGAASKLLTHFRRMNPNKSIVSYADRRLSIGNVYKTLGFEFSHHSPPSYFYTKDGFNTISRYSTQRKVLGKVIKNFDPSLSEAQNMYQNGYYKVYDSGTSVWMLN